MNHLIDELKARAKLLREKRKGSIGRGRGAVGGGGGGGGGNDGEGLGGERPTALYPSPVGEVSMVEWN